MVGRPLSCLGPVPPGADWGCCVGPVRPSVSGGCGCGLVCPVIFLRASQAPGGGGWHKASGGPRGGGVQHGA